MKRLFIQTLLLFAVLSASGQIAVESFRLLETDLTAITAGTQETDQNGEVAALIKVVTTQKGFTFDNGMLGIVKIVQQPAEIWVYVPQKTQKISISHPDLGMLRNYYFQIPIECGRTYELKLTTSRVKTIIEEDAGGGFLALKVEPSSANVYVDDQPQALNDEGMLSLFLLYGEHTYRVEALGYKTEMGKVNIASDETQTVTVALTSTMARLTLSSSMPDVEIWVNNELKGKEQWTGGLAAGTYIVEGRKPGHRSRRTTVTLAENEEKTMTIPDPEPILGRLRAESNPLEAEVWLEGNKLGTTPGIFSDILAGKHEIRFTKEGYVSQTVEVTVEEGKIAAASVTLQKNAATLSREKTAKDAAKREAVSPQPKKPSAQTALLRKTSFYLDAHFHLGTPSAAGAAIGAYLGGFNVEGAWGLPLSRGESVTMYQQQSSDHYKTVQVTYTPTSLLSANVGYGISAGKRLRLTPRAGFGVLAVKGTGDLTQNTYVFSGMASLRTELALSRVLSLYVAPAYTIPFQRGETARRLSSNVDAISKWNNGFALRAGIAINF